MSCCSYYKCFWPLVKAQEWSLQHRRIPSSLAQRFSRDPSPKQCPSPTAAAQSRAHSAGRTSRDLYYSISRVQCHWWKPRCKQRPVGKGDLELADDETLVGSESFQLKEKDQTERLSRPGDGEENRVGLI